ncbi:hypothetical protein BaRGS_00001778 [Batillaria attramentaria]|uniref:Uncharacterized protein n=1 Tax=Batillaria attramentaria TaxID=370345 RepID=A0ABD0M5K0_9CAEN
MGSESDTWKQQAQKVSGGTDAREKCWETDTYLKCCEIDSREISREICWELTLGGKCWETDRKCSETDTRDDGGKLSVQKVLDDTDKRDDGGKLSVEKVLETDTVTREDGGKLSVQKVLDTARDDDDGKLSVERVPETDTSEDVFLSLRSVQAEDSDYTTRPTDRQGLLPLTGHVAASDLYQCPPF